MENKNYYDLLEVSTNSSPEEIYKSYQRAKNAYTGDSIALYSLLTSDECAAMVEQIEEAYTILSDSRKRKQYDEIKGIKKIFKSNTESSSEDQIQKESIKKESQQTSMSKIVAKQRFHLEYKVDPNFEKEIESTSQFSGEFLKQIREYKKVDLQRMADLTKVSKTYLSYIEQEAFDKLPASVYVRGFVFQYAKCLKLNPDLVATSFLTRLKTVVSHHE